MTTPPNEPPAAALPTADRIPKPESLVNLPNVLTLARLPLAAVLFACIAYQLWLAGLAVFLLASLTDWFDGYLARRWDQLTAFGRSFDPLIDKVLVCGAFVYLIPVPESGLLPWMVTVVIGRELLITGLRGYLETVGEKFGADQLGKLKMGLQCAVLIGFFLLQTLRDYEASSLADGLRPVYVALVWLMLAATVASGVQYVWRGLKLLRRASEGPP